MEAARLRSRRSLLEKSVGDDVGWEEPSFKPALFVDGLHEQFQVTAGRILVLGEGHILAYDADTRVSATGDIDADRIKFRVRDVAGATLQSRASSSATTWRPIRLRSRLGDRYQEFSLADLRAGKIGFLAGDGTSDITFTIQALDDHGNLSDSDRNDNQNDADPASVSIPVVALKEIEAGTERRAQGRQPAWRAHSGSGYAAGVAQCGWHAGDIRGVAGRQERNRRARRRRSGRESLFVCWCFQHHGDLGRGERQTILAGKCFCHGF